MKVLMTADPLGGVWTYALELARGLAERDVRVSLAIEGAALSVDQRADLRDAPLDGWWSSARKVEWMEDPWTDVDANTAWLLEIASEVRPDVVHLSSFGHAAAAWPAPVVVTAHSCVLSWWRAVKEDSAPPAWDEYARRVRSGLQRASLVVAPTEAFLRELLRIYGFDGPTAVVANGLDVSGHPGDKTPVVLAAGRVWDEGKNVALLEGVAPELPWPVVVLGEGGHADAPNVQRAGRVSRAEVQRWMRRAAIFCAPARYEPFGLAALEAGANGCALVLGNIPTLREVWGDAALFVDPEDASELRQACLVLIEDAALREDLAARARRRAALFHRARMADGYLRLYRSLAHSNAAEEVAAR